MLLFSPKLRSQPTPSRQGKATTPSRGLLDTLPNTLHRQKKFGKSSEALVCPFPPLNLTMSITKASEILKYRVGIHLECFFSKICKLYPHYKIEKSPRHCNPFFFLLIGLDIFSTLLLHFER